MQSPPSFITYCLVVLLSVFGSLPFAVQSQTVNLTIPSNRYAVDYSNHLIVVNSQNSYPNTAAATLVSIDLDQTYSFNTVPSELENGVGYEVSNLTDEYTLFFSPLPLLSINTDSAIVDEPAVHGTITFSEPESEPLISHLGIETRGGFSQTYPKKSFRFDLWEDATGEVKNNLSLAGMREDDDWLLTAMYNEPLRIRNISGQKLWSDIHTLYYVTEQPDAKSTIDAHYVDVFTNGNYQGVYLLTERIDRKLLQLEKFEVEPRGELYKGVTWGASQYYNCPPYNNNLRIWSGFEMQYPKEDEFTDWENLYNAVNLIVSGTELDIDQEFLEQFEIDNMVDYFVFLNLLHATDNLGKNVYVAKYNQNHPYFFIPWDLDGVFGTQYAGEQDTSHSNILGNGLYSRLMGDNHHYFFSRAAVRWFELREEEFDENALIERLSENINLLQISGAYEREELIWSDFEYDESNQTYMFNWIHNRLEFLDEYFSTFLSVQEQEQVSILIYPNPTTGLIRVESSSRILGTEIIDRLGRSVSVASNRYTSGQLDLTALPSGLYHIRFILEESTQVQSIIKTE